MLQRGNVDLGTSAPHIRWSGAKHWSLGIKSPRNVCCGDILTNFAAQGTLSIDKLQFLLGQGVKNNPSFRSWMPESSVQGWQVTAYGKSIASLLLYVPVTGCIRDILVPKDTGQGCPVS